MEKILEKQMVELNNSPEIIGTICTDKQGLCLSVHGVAEKGSSGVISSLASQAASLSQDQPDKPVVCIESDVGNILIREKDEATLAIYKQKIGS